MIIYIVVAESGVNIGYFSTREKAVARKRDYDDTGRSGRIVERYLDVD